MSSPPIPTFPPADPSPADPRDAWSGSPRAAIVGQAAQDAATGRAERARSGMLRSRWVHRGGARKHAPVAVLEDCPTPGHDGDFPAVAACLMARTDRATCAICGGRAILEDY